MAKFLYKKINFKIFKKNEQKRCLKSNIEYIQSQIEKDFNFNFFFVIKILM